MNRKLFVCKTSIFSDSLILDKKTLRELEISNLSFVCYIELPEVSSTPKQAELAIVQ